MSLFPQPTRTRSPTAVGRVPRAADRAGGVSARRERSLGGARRGGTRGTHLVVPRGSELHVVAVLPDLALALRTRSHRALLRESSRLDRRVLSQCPGGAPGRRLWSLRSLPPQSRPV